MAHLELHTLTKRYGDVVSVDSIELAVDQGEFICLLGPPRTLSGPRGGDRGGTPSFPECRLSVLRSRVARSESARLEASSLAR